MLTDLLGRATYMVQGVKSTRGHGNKAALLQPMFPVEFEGLESPRAEMHRLRELRAAPPLRSIPFDVRKSTIALFMAEMLYRLVREVEPNSELFEFVYGAVQALDGAANANFHLWFMVGLSRHLGFFPAGEWQPGWWFDIREGVFTPVMPRGEAFSRENAALLSRLMAINAAAPVARTAPEADVASVHPSIPADLADPAVPNALADRHPSLADDLASIALNRAQRADFMNAMLAYFGYHLDATRDIRSVDILREVF
jgi:DNA repair protein RecO (recombination protein O)